MTSYCSTSYFQIPLLRQALSVGCNAYEIFSCSLLHRWADGFLLGWMDNKYFNLY